MKLLGLFNLFGSCAASFTAAVLVFQMGYGLIAAFLAYAFGGAFLMILMTTLMFVVPQVYNVAVPDEREVIKAKLIEIRA